MPWLLVLHICTLLLWCASLLYLPALISGGKSEARRLDQHSPIELSRLLFTQVATPLGLLTIISGTLIFFTQHNVERWLILKLTLVSGLVISHVLHGWLIMRIEKKLSPAPQQTPNCPVCYWHWYHFFYYRHYHPCPAETVVESFVGLTDLSCSATINPLPEIALESRGSQP